MLKLFFFLTIFLPIIFSNPVKETPKVKDDVVRQEVLDEEKLTVLSRKPAMKLKLTKKGMDYLHEKAVESFNNKLIGLMKFEDKTFEKDNFTIVVMNLTVTYDAPKFTYTTVPSSSNMIVCRGLGGRMTMVGEYEVKVSDSRPSTVCKCVMKVCSIHQTMEKVETEKTIRPFVVVMSQFNFTTTVALTAKNGKPSMRMDSCSTDVGSMEMDFNCTSKTCENMKLDVAQFWNETMNAMVCRMMSGGVTKINNVMQSFKTTLPIGTSPYHVEYSMLGSPKCQLDMCETMHTAEITCNDTDVPLLPAPLPDFNEDTTKSMAIMQISDYMMNSYADSVFRSGMMNVTICNETAPPEMATMLRTTCEEKELCVGSISKDLVTKYPNTSG